MTDQLAVGLISVTKIASHPSNIGRNLGDLRDLTASIKAKGVLVPVVVEKYGVGYRLRDGHRRVAAARIAGVPKVTALIHAEHLPEAAWLLESVDYNERRKGYTVDDKRRVVLRLIELGVTRGAIAEAFGVSWSAIARILNPEPTTALAVARQQVARQSPVVSRKALREFITHCEQAGYRGQDVVVMLAAFVDGRPWRDVDQADEVPA